MRSGDVAACGADDLGLEHAAKDALHNALRLHEACEPHCPACKAATSNLHLNPDVHAKS